MWLHTILDDKKERTLMPYLVSNVARVSGLSILDCPFGVNVNVNLPSEWTILDYWVKLVLGNFTIRVYEVLYIPNTI